MCSAHECNQQLQSTLQTERQFALCESRDMEARLLDAQNCLMEKVREVTAARDAQTGLKSEIASLRALIESAEMRCRHPALYSSAKFGRFPVFAQLPQTGFLSPSKFI